VHTIRDVVTHVVLPSPIGELTLVAANGQLTSLYMDAQQHRPDGAMFGAVGNPTDEPFASAGAQLDAYFARDLKVFDLPLAPAGTQFQRRVWSALQAIPYGQTCSYGELARRVGSAGRAVGLANGKNPIALIIPCHRVIGSDGSLTGYGGGLDRKRYLLELEGDAATSSRSEPEAELELGARCARPASPGDGFGQLRTIGWFRAPRP
jgi:methylated-DNA-[protein]-cysteine S-methyltransferase